MAAVVILAAGCAMAPEPVRMATTESREDPAYSLYTYFLFPREPVAEGGVLPRYRALVEQVAAAPAGPAGTLPRAINQLVVPTAATRPQALGLLESVDTTVSRIYVEALSCLLPLYPPLQARLLAGAGPFAVTTAPGLNTLAFRNRITIGAASPEQLRQREVHVMMDWMLIVDLSGADPPQVRALAKVYQEPLDPRAYYQHERKLSELADRLRHAVPALQADVHLVAAQIGAFMPGMMPGQGCSEYSGVLVYSGAVGHFRRAEMLARGGDATSASRDLDRAIELEPTFAGAFHLRGSLKLEQGELDAALRDLDRAIDIDRSVAGPHADRALVYYKLRRYPEAVVDISVYIAARPHESLPYCNRALARAQLGEFEQAQQDLDQCTRLGGRLEETTAQAIARLREAAGQR